MTSNNPKNIQTQAQQLIATLYNTVTYHQKIGIKHYFANENLHCFLSARPIIPKKLRTLAPEQQITPLHTTNKQSAKSSSLKKVFGHSSIQQNQLHQHIATCTNCPLHKQRYKTKNNRDGIICGGSLKTVKRSDKKEPIRLMLIGNWYHQNKKKEVEENGFFFGNAENIMVEKMIAAIKLPPSAVYVTNAIKCYTPEKFIPKGRSELQNCLQQCARFLHSEIEQIRPEFICAMGTEAARFLLPAMKNLSQARSRQQMGQFYHYQGNGYTIPFIVTFHPNYLLNATEMKKPTWLDLQMLAKKMNLL